MSDQAIQDAIAALRALTKRPGYPDWSLVRSDAMLAIVAKLEAHLLATE